MKQLRRSASTDEGPAQPVAHLALSPADLEQTLRDAPHPCAR
jgi:hypothetical protein